MELRNTVFAFDRDYTVSVNPHPDHKAVPLSWVKYLAHGCEGVDVWATGNQRLRCEAAIPGVAWAKRLYDELEGRPFEQTTVTESDGYYSNYLPERRQGLRTVRSVYEHPDSAIDPDDVGFVVVDDVDLRDMRSEGWDHYYAWDFVEAFDGISDESGAFCDTLASSSDCTCRELFPSETFCLLS